jgi:hypothetical protein
MVFIDLGLALLYCSFPIFVVAILALNQIKCPLTIIHCGLNHLSFNSAIYVLRFPPFVINKTSALGDQWKSSIWKLMGFQICLKF